MPARRSIFRLATLTECIVGPLFSCMALATESTGAFPHDTAVRSELRAFVEIHRGTPGVVLGLMDASGTRVFAYGESGRPERTKMDGTTRFEIGSITKTFTALLLAEMTLTGEVSTGQQVSTLFPKTITLDNGVQYALPWRRPGAWSMVGRGLNTALEIAVLIALLL